MIFKKIEQPDFEKSVRKCWIADPSIQKFSRNSECELDERIEKELACFKLAHNSFKFYDIFDEQDKYVGYFGFELEPLPWLTTFFIMPEFRNNKKEVWTYIISHLPRPFFSGLFKVNTRAISYFIANGGINLGEYEQENKPVYMFRFER